MLDKKRVFYEIGGNENRVYVEATVRIKGKKYGIGESSLLAYGPKKYAEEETKKKAKEKLKEYAEMYLGYKDEYELI